MFPTDKQCVGISAGFRQPPPRLSFAAGEQPLAKDNACTPKHPRSPSSPAAAAGSARAWRCTWPSAASTSSSPTAPASRGRRGACAQSKPWAQGRRPAARRRRQPQLRRLRRGGAARARRTWQRERFDYLVNNAGIGLHAPFAETTEAQFDELMNVHLKGAVPPDAALLAAPRRRRPHPQRVERPGALHPPRLRRPTRR